MSHASPPEVLFLDAAGTLIHVAEPVGETYARFAEAHEIKVDATALECAFRRTWKMLPAPLHHGDTPPADDDRAWWHELVQRSFADVLGREVPEATLDPLFDALYTHFARAEAWRLFDDAFPALEALHGRVRLIVLSNFDRRLHSVLDGLGIARFFEAVVLSSEVGASKPHPRMFAAALRTAGVAPAHCMHVGDESEADVAGAQAAGIPVLQVQRPQTTLLTVAEKVLAQMHSCLRTP